MKLVKLLGMLKSHLRVKLCIQTLQTTNMNFEKYVGLTTGFQNAKYEKKKDPCINFVNLRSSLKCTTFKLGSFIAGVQFHAIQNRSKSKPFNRLSPESKK